MRKYGDRPARPWLLLLATVSLTAVSVFSCGRTVELDGDFTKLLTYSYGDSREPLMAVHQRILSSYGDAEARLNLELQLAELLTLDTSWECRDFACRQLMLIGTKESVPVLAKMLIDEKTSDIARYALQQNSCPEADRALLDALGKTQGKTLIGIINSLGERRNEKNVKKLAGLTVRSDEDVALAAVAALGKIGGENAVKALERARSQGTPQVHYAASRALLLCADNLMTRNKKDIKEPAK